LYQSILFMWSSSSQYIAHVARVSHHVVRVYHIMVYQFIVSTWSAYITVPHIVRVS